LALDSRFGRPVAPGASDDGHAWEIAHNPGFELREDGSLIVPRFDTNP